MIDLVELGKDLDEASAVAEVHAGVRRALAAGRTLLAALAEAQRERDELREEVDALAIDLAEERTETQAALAAAHADADRYRHLYDEKITEVDRAAAEAERMIEIVRAAKNTAQAEVERMRPVVNLVRRLAERAKHSTAPRTELFEQILAAVDTYESQTGGTE